MPLPVPLTEAQVYHRCPPEVLSFATTESLDDLELPCGQERVLRALEFGAGMSAAGFNLFVLGPSGVGKHDLVNRFLTRHAAQQTVPSDWCYVLNFQQAEKPRVLAFPAGQGRSFRQDMADLASELRTSVPATFESEEYQARLQELQEEVSQHQQEGLSAIQQEANDNNIAMITTPTGFTFAPMRRNGEVIDPDDYQKLSDDERTLIESKVEDLEKKLQQSIQQIPKLRKEVRERVRSLNEEMVQLTLGAPMGELRERWSHLPEVIRYLDAVQEDVVEHAELFRDNEHGPPKALLARYDINLLVDNADTRGAPVVYEDLPSHQHLTGQIEHHARQGTLYTDFTLIRGGSIHRANGGYLIIDARRILTQPLAWESLKRVLLSSELRIESLERLYGLMSTVSLQPEPIPVSVKVVLLGDRMLYYRLSHYDPDFLELFKVEADFADDLERREDGYLLYARMVATIARSLGTRPVQRDAVARLIEHGSRMADDQRKVSAHDRVIRDLLSEADHWAGTEGAHTMDASHVQRAIDEREYRASRVRELSREQITRGIVMIATKGHAIALVNGLSVLQLGASRFGQPTRISATARPGKGQVVDIEREAKLGGPIHSKAVMILSRFLASRYAGEGELSLSASVAFEQSYGGVEGDSASVAETCVLLSAIARIPLRQSYAVTGSMNQHGDVQAVGGVNEKIEGFFDVCREAGVVDGQGVLLPASNVEHLMLRADVREAVADGRFRIYPISHIDQAIALLTDLPAGAPDADGVFPEGSVNAAVAERLSRFVAISKAQDDEAKPSEPGGENDHG